MAMVAGHLSQNLLVTLSITAPPLSLSMHWLYSFHRFLVLFVKFSLFLFIFFSIFLYGFYEAGLQRCGKSCRLRWTNYLRPDLKRGSFSTQEAALIIELHGILGNKYLLFLFQKCLNYYQFYYKNLYKDVTINIISDTSTT